MKNKNIIADHKLSLSYRQEISADLMERCCRSFDMAWPNIIFLNKKRSQENPAALKIYRVSKKDPNR